MLLRDCRIASIQSGKALSALVRVHPARESRSVLLVLGTWQGHPHSTAITGRSSAPNRPRNHRILTPTSS
jgi:hypothetical protein